MAKTKPTKTKSTTEKPETTVIEVTSKAVDAKSPKSASVSSKKCRPRAPKVTVLLDTDDIVRDQVGGFVTFLREHAIVGLAVGFVAGTQAQAVVKQLVTSFIDPLLKLLFGTKLSDLQFTLHLGQHSASFLWGAMIYALINLLFVMASVYALIKIFNLDKLDKPKDAAPAPVVTKK